MKYRTIFGGVVGMTPALYTYVDGFSTIFKGWGGEDDDLYKR